MIRSPAGSVPSPDTQEDILALFRRTGALLEGSFQLSSGLHSPQYFQCARVLQYPEHAEALCGRIAARFRNESVGVVIAPALGGIVVAQEVGRQLNVRSIFAERRENELILRRGLEIAPGERVLVCEDVITTGGSVEEVMKIVRGSGGTLVCVGAIVDRSGGTVGFENSYSTVTLKVLAYKPDECPLCKLEVPIETPGSREAFHGKAPMSAQNRRT